MCNQVLPALLNQYDPAVGDFIWIMIQHGADGKALVLL